MNLNVNRRVLTLFVVSASALSLLAVTGCGPQGSKSSVTVVDEGDHPFEQPMTESAGPAMVEILTDTSAPAAPGAAATVTTPVVVDTTAPTPEVTATVPDAAAPVSSAAPQLPSGEVTFEAKIQLALQKAGYYKGVVDGKVGQDTRDAIRAFQKAQGLRADGMVGSSTWEKLKKFYDNP